MEKVEELIESPDEKISLKACAIILAKVLPESKLLPSWQEKDKGAVAEEVQQFKEFIVWKMEQDIKRAGEKGILRSDEGISKDPKD